MATKLLSLSEIQEIEFSLLERFIQHCEKNNYSYALTYGTLLGAVRHKGFIPWDDDIDVMMLRQDYEKFICDFQDNSPIIDCELLVRGKRKNYFYPFIKLCDQNTMAKMEDNQTEHGIWVDIFPVDHVPIDEKAARLFHRKIRFFKNLVISYTTDFSTKHKNLKLVAKLFFSCIAHLVGINRIVNYIEKESIKYNNANTNRVSIVCWQSSEGGNMLEKDLVNPAKLEFNGLHVNGPSDYNTYLLSIYGDYMTIPPENNRSTHHLTAYHKMIKKEQ